MHQPRTPEEIAALSADDIIEIAKEANIIDEASGKSLWKEMAAARRSKAKTLAADAIDDEPYISSQLNPLLKNPEQAIGGLQLAAKACKKENICVVVYKNLMDIEVKIPKKIQEVPIKRVRGTYPAEVRALGRAVKKEDTRFIGVCALIHLFRAVYLRQPQMTSFVTVAGNCVATPVNLEVSNGMTVMQILDRCGLAQDPNKIVVGGSMTGVTVIDPDKTAVTPVTRGVLAFKEDVRDMHYRCIGCGRCAQVCPQGLNPYYLYRYVKHKRYKYRDIFDIEQCRNCATCSYICPAKLDLAATIYEGKQYIQERTQRESSNDEIQV